MAKVKQGDLFGEGSGRDCYGSAIRVGPARAHAGDPLTSHEAAARVTKSERAARHRAIVLSLVQANPSSTGHELFAEATPEEQKELENAVEIYRKLNDLKHAGKVIQGEPRVCRVRGVRMVVWLPAPTSEETKKT